MTHQSSELKAESASATVTWIWKENHYHWSLLILETGISELDLSLEIKVLQNVHGGVQKLWIKLNLDIFRKELYFVKRIAVGGIQFLANCIVSFHK